MLKRSPLTLKERLPNIKQSQSYSDPPVLKYHLNHSVKSMR